MARKPAFISHSSEREAQIQARLMERLEARFRRHIAAAIVQESGRIVSGYRALGYVPPVSDQHPQEMRAVYKELSLACTRTFGRRIVAQGKAAGFVVETKQEGGFFEFFRSVALAWINLEPIRRRIQSVTETTRAQIVSQVARGQERGLGVEAIARTITQRTPEISRTRAALIARTETHGASNFAMHQVAKSTSLTLEKEWVSTEDMRTRSIMRDDEFDHVSMNGQRRDMDEPFSMPWAGGEPLPIMYPGQAGLPGGAVINCRCAVVHHVKGGLLGD